MCKNAGGGDSSDGVECPTCGREYGSEFGMKLHHKKTHGESIAGVPVDCSHCGTTFRKAQCRVDDSDYHFCCGECQGEYYSENFSGGDSWHWKGGGTTVDCAWCGNSFTVETYRTEQTERFFCPDEDCQREWRSENRTGPDNTYWKGGGVDVQCANCDKSKTVDSTAYRRHERHFCDMECLGEWRSENRRGETHPLYKGESFDYGPGWNHRKREQVRNRDGRVCQDCGMTAIQHRMKYDLRLNVHHIQSARSFDDVEKRNAMGNLLTLCQSCHPKWNRLSPLRPA